MFYTPFEYPLYGLQSWYFGYVLAATTVVVCFTLVHISKKQRSSILLWLPLAVMLVICIAVERLSIESSRISALMTLAAEHRHDNLDYSREEALNIVHHWLYRVGFQRWGRGVPQYLLATEVFAAAAYLISQRTKYISKTKVSGASSFVLCLMLSLCIFDRTFALSAKLMLPEPKGFPDWCVGEWNGVDVYSLEYSTQRMILGTPEVDLSLAKQPVYAEPSFGSELIDHSDECGVIGINATEKRGWAFTNQSAGWTKDENGRSKRLVGFVPLERAIRTAGNGKEDWPLIIMARPNVMLADMVMFSMGYGVTENFMHVFEPFEIYLLVPLTALFGIIWLTLLIRGRISKRKTKLT